MDLNAVPESSNVSQRLPCQEARLFTMDQACWVFVNYIDEDGLWVMLESEEQIMMVISDALNKADSHDHDRVENPTVNDVVSALNTDDTWYRAIIEAVEPEIKVRFIDFGDVLVVPKENLAPLPSTLSIQRQLAMRVQLPPDSSLTPFVGAKMLVKSVCCRMGSVVVDVIQSEEETMVPDSTVCSKETSLDCPSLQHSEIGASAQATSELIQSCDNREPVESSSLSVLDVPPPSGFSSDVLSEPELKENAPVPTDVLVTLATTTTNPVESSGAIGFEKYSHESVSSNLISLSCTSDEGKPLDHCNQTLEEPVRPESRENSGVKTIIPAGNFMENTPTPPKADHSAQMNSSLSVAVSTPADQEIAMSVQGNNTSNTHNELMNLNTCSAATRKSNSCVSNGSEENNAQHSLISALEQYPHIGGGYAAHSDTAERKLNAKQSSYTPRIITKGRNNETPRFVRKQDTQPPPTSSTSKVSSQKSFGYSSPQDFNTILEFELSVIREQNRLQLLQLQKKMEQNMSNQIKAVREEFSKQLAMVRNEVNGRLMVINDSVVNKMADIYSDITLLKNDQEMNAYNRPSSGCAPLPHKHQDTHMSSGGMPELLPFPSTHDEDSHERIQHRTGDAGMRNSNFHANLNDHHQGNFSSRFKLSKKDLSAIDDMKGPATNLMEVRKEKMKEQNKGRDYNQSHHHKEMTVERSSNQSYHHTTPMYQNLDEHLDRQHSNFPVGQFDPDCMVMDHFDPSKTGHGHETVSDTATNKGGSGCIICVNNLVAEKINPDMLFNLFGVYGNIQRIKLSQQDKRRAYIEMETSSQAEEVIRHLNKAPLMGQRLHVTPCSFEKLMFSRKDIDDNICKDWSRSPNLVKMNRFNRFDWDPSKLVGPSSKLKIFNVLKSVGDDKLKEDFAKSGFRIQSINSQSCSYDAENEKKVVYVTFGSIEEAVNALTVMHLKESTDWMRMRIYFC